MKLPLLLPILLLSACATPPRVVNPHADVQVVLLSDSEMREIASDPALPRLPHNRRPPVSAASIDTIYLLETTDRLEFARAFLRELREKGLLVNDGRALAPTDLGVGK